jgi:hypothetical protein
MTPETNDEHLLRLCADYPAVKQKMFDMLDVQDAEAGNESGLALARWDDLKSEIADTKAGTLAGLVAKAQVCCDAFHEKAGTPGSYESHELFALEVMRDLLRFGMAATSAEQAALTAH